MTLIAPPCECPDGICYGEKLAVARNQICLRWADGIHSERVQVPKIVTGLPLADRIDAVLVPTFYDYTDDQLLAFLNTCLDLLREAKEALANV